ncbi:cobalamin-binding protein [Saccharospirillum mangrovi]|uniref:cobalamin-binding protein n=1 Tax=Saccharospirillum mangrovi TaxID=2161747 RepID=UPI000D3C5A0F|nr:cobalamin-binding protein [Saccharospirillum mangrovi]
MKKLLLCLCALVVLDAQADVQITDDLGRSVTLTQPAQRVVSLVPHATELLYYIQAQDALIATVRFADYPEAAKAITRVGDYNTVNTEAILTLQPDLIIAYPDAPNRAQVDRLVALGMPVFFSDPQSFDSIATALRDFGQLTGHNESAEAAAHDFETGIHTLADQFAERSELSVFYEVWHQPIYTLNGDSYISDVIALCGGRNVFAELPVISPQISIETVLAADPDVIVTDQGDQWLQWSRLRAVQHNALIQADSERLHRPTPSLLTAATQLCADLDRIRAAYGD